MSVGLTLCTRETRVDLVRVREDGALDLLLGSAPSVTVGLLVRDELRREACGQRFEVVETRTTRERRVVD